MPKKITSCLMVVVISSTLFAQQIKPFTQPEQKVEKTSKTKMEAFISKRGTIIKFTDYPLTWLKLSGGPLLGGLTYGVAQPRVRKLISDGDTLYFYQIQRAGAVESWYTGSIEYSDLLEVIRALQTLKAEFEIDKKSDPFYLENKFITVDNFEVGYFISQGKGKWALTLEKLDFVSDNTFFISDVENIEAAFKEAKDKIEELKR